MRFCAALTYAVLIAAAVPVCATEHIVDAAGGGEFEDLRTAMNASVSGDTIRVLPGIYSGANNTGLRPYGKDIVWIAESDFEDPVIIDCESSGYAVQFENGIDDSTLFTGFTIESGGNTGNGGGMIINQTSPTIENCTFLNCTAPNGGAIAIYYSDSLITGCTFRGNNADNRGGAIYCTTSTLTLTDCLFDENSATTGGSGAFLQGGTDVVTLCTFVENVDEQITVYGSTSDISISNCVIADSPDGISVGVNAAGTGMVTHCILFGNVGGDTPACNHEDNLYVDPLFCSSAPNDYTHCEDSPAIADNNAWDEKVGAFEAGCEACGTPVESATWGVVKSIFR